MLLALSLGGVLLPGCVAVTCTAVFSRRQAVNLTAVVGDKGGSDVPSFVTCGTEAAENGENVVTAALEPAKQTMYALYCCVLY